MSVAVMIRAGTVVGFAEPSPRDPRTRENRAVKCPALPGPDIYQDLDFKIVF